jgi:hypothetical protein
MEIYRISRNLILLLLMLTVTAILFFCVDFKENLSGLDKELGRKDLADFNWAFAR